MPVPIPRTYLPRLLPDRADVRRAAPGRDDSSGSGRCAGAVRAGTPSAASARRWTAAQSERQVSPRWTCHRAQQPPCRRLGRQGMPAQGPGREVDELVYCAV